MKLFYLFLSFYITFNSIILAQDIAWVDEFGTDGILVKNIPSWNTQITQMKILEDDKILLSGNIGSLIFVAYINSSGEFITPNPNLNQVKIVNEGWSITLTDMKVQHDNKIILSGGNDAMVLMRLKTDLSFDSTFGMNGILNMTAYKKVEKISLLNNGKILCYTHGQSDNAPYLIQINNDGKLDHSFADNGSKKLDYKFSTMNSLADNSIILTGVNAGNLIVQKYLQSGTIDNNFGIQGTVIYNSVPFGRAYNCEILSDGKILLVADFANLVRLNSDGSIDTSFGTDGFVSNPEALDQFFVYGNSESTQIKLLSNGKVLVGGVLSTLDQWLDIFVFQLDTDGNVDTTFSGGYVRTHNNSKAYYQAAKTMDMFSNGIILLGGYESIRKTDNMGEYFEHNMLLGKLFGSGVPYIQTVKTLFLTSPNGGEQLKQNDEITITWENIGNTNINIEFSSDNGQSWSDIASNLSAEEHEYSWLVPNIESDECLLRINNEDKSFVDQSDSLFAIINTDPSKGWIQSLSMDDHNFSSISLLWSNGFLGWTISQDKVIYTTDSGVNWNEVDPAPSIGGYLSDIFFVNTNTGFVLSNSIAAQVYQTTNGGLNWASVHKSPNFQSNVDSYNAIYFSDEQHGWICGERWPNGLILKTSDGGTTWEEKSNSDIPNYLTSIFFINNDIGWVTARLGAIGITTNGGNSWYITYQVVEPTSIHFANENIGYIAGKGGKVLKSTDGGYNWSEKNTGESEDLNSIYFQDSNTGWVVGDNGLILFTQDGGDTWIQQQSNTTRKLNKIVSNYYNNLYVAGDGVILYSTTGGGITTIAEEKTLINDFSLSQNYPNPFNPATTINYSIPKTSVVTLKVYDVLGKEIAILVNEEKASGNYRIQFDGSTLSSGVYFYRIQADKFSQTKKLILMK